MKIIKEYDTLTNIRNGVEAVQVYHGTILRYAVDIYNNGIDLKKSKPYLDFGQGFYTTDNFEMARNMARRISARELRQKDIENAFPAVITFEYKEVPGLNYKKFEYEDIEWARFIMANRITPEIAAKLGLKDSNVDLKYDIVIGGTADGEIASIASDLRYGRLQAEYYNLQLSDFLKSDGSSYGKQIAFHTQKALSCIEYVECVTI